MHATFLLPHAQLLLTLPMSIPVGGLLAFMCTSWDVLRSLFVVFTPFLWPLAFLCKWWHITCCVSQVRGNPDYLLN
jgi:hypothetical protein